SSSSQRLAIICSLLRGLLASRRKKQSSRARLVHHAVTGFSFNITVGSPNPSNLIIGEAGLVERERDPESGCFCGRVGSCSSRQERKGAISGNMCTALISAGKRRSSQCATCFWLLEATRRATTSSTAFTAACRFFASRQVASRSFVLM